MTDVLHEWKRDQVSFSDVHADTQKGSAQWVVLEDPEGNLFCVIDKRT